MKRTSLIALGAFVALLLVYLATRETQVSAGTRSLDLTALDPAKVTAIDANGISLKKQGADWTVNGKAADGQLVTDALAGLAKVKTNEVITDRPEKHAEYELGEDKAVKVKLTREGGAPIEVWLGKTAKNGGAYARLPGENAVFVAPPAASRSFKRDEKGWRTRRFVPFKAEDVTALTVKPAGDAPYTVERAGQEWKLADGTQAPAGFRFDPAAAAQVVAQLTALHATDFFDDKADEALGSAEKRHSVQAKLASGSTTSVHFGPAAKKDESGPELVPVRVDGDPQTYLVSGWTGSQVTKRLAELRDLSLFNFDPQKVSKVELRHGAMRVVATKDGGAWKLVEPKKLPAGYEFDPSQVPAQLAAFRAIRAQKVADEAGLTEGKVGLTRPEASIDVALEGGGKQSLRIGKATAGGMYAKGAVDAALYVVGAGEKSRVERGIELFRKREAPPSFAGPNNLDQLPPDLRAKIEAAMRAQGAQ